MWQTIFDSLVFFVPFFVLWLELNVTLIRFADVQGDFAGMVDDILLFVFLCGVIVLSVQIQVNEDLFDPSKNINIIGGMLVCVGCLWLLHIFYYSQIAASSKLKPFFCTLSLSLSLSLSSLDRWLPLAP